MRKYTDDQVARANSVDLAAFLSAKGEKFIKAGKEYRWSKHDSVTIHKNEWFRHSQGKGGGPVDFMMEFYGMAFPDAVKELLGGEEPGDEKAVSQNGDTALNKGAYSQNCYEAENVKVDKDDDVVDGGPAVADPIPTREVELPEKDMDQSHIIEYLTKARKLDPDIVKEFMERGDIFQEKEHQRVVFVGRDSEQTVRFGSWRNAGHEQIRGDVTGSMKEYGFKSLASWPRNKEKDRTSRNLYVFESPIDLLSFITLYPKYWNESHYLSLGGVSAKALVTFLSDRPDVEHIYLCLDNDRAGHEACAKILEHIPERYAVTQIVPLKKDWNEVLVQRTGQPEEKYYSSRVELRASGEKLVPMIRMSDVKPTTVDWLWYPFIPFGKVTLIQGDPGQGKTWLAMHLAAACTNKKELPNELPMDSFNVIYQTAEDGVADTIKPRLIQCGADMERVRIIDEEDEMLSLTDPRLELAIKQNNVKLIIMDPIQAYLGPDVDMNRANEIRPLFRYLGGVAERTGAAIVLIGHLNKNSGTQANYRGLGSVDISAAVRSILLVGKVEKEQDKDIRVVIQTKSSLAPKPTPVAFTLENSKVEWIGEYEITEQELMSGKSGKQTETKLDKGINLIRRLLTERKLMYVADLDSEGKKLKISDRTMRDARRKIENELEYGYEDSKKTVHLKK